MAIIRTHHDKSNPYVILNKKSLWDDDLSLEAVGLWARLMSRPDDWKIHVTELAKVCKCGKDRIYRILHELIDHGYAHMFQHKNEKGRWAENEYFVFESKMSPDQIKEMFPVRQNPEAVSPISDNPPLLNTECLLSNDKRIVCPVAENTEEIKKLNAKKNEVIVNKQDFYRHCIQERKDYSSQEIEESWKILTHYQGAVNNPYHFLEGTITNLRAKLKLEKMNKSSETKVEEKSHEEKIKESAERIKQLQQRNERGKA